jgi:hypothetical protein
LQRSFGNFPGKLPARIPAVKATALRAAADVQISPSGVDERAG